MLTVAELEALFLDMESDRIERKPSLSERDDIRKAICAYANDLPGHGKPGVIFVGVKDTVIPRRSFNSNPAACWW